MQSDRPSKQEPAELIQTSVTERGKGIHVLWGRGGCQINYGVFIPLWENNQDIFQTYCGAELWRIAKELAEQREETRLIIEELLEDGSDPDALYAIEHHISCENFETLRKAAVEVF